MREIKFRVWDKDRKIMIMDSNKIYPSITLSGSIIAYNNNERICDKNLILMQFTGRKDKNEKEIYDGDIVKVEKHFEDDINIPEHKVLVAFKEGSWALVHLNLAGNQYIFDLDQEVINDRVEVIGNKFQNPELLETD